MQHVLLFLLIVLTSGAYAEDIIINGEPFIAAGPKGRYTIEQGQVLLSRSVSGEVLKSSMYRHKDQTFYIYKILMRDNGVYDVEINALGGKMRSIKVDTLGESEFFPFTTISKELASTLALSYVSEETRGGRKPQFKSLSIGVHKRKPAFVIGVKKAGAKYNVMVDAVEGRVLDLIEAD